MSFDQTDRLIKIKSDLPELAADKVCGISFSANEAISRLFHFQLEFLCMDLQLTGEKMLGKPVTVEIQQFDDQGEITGSRFFHGYINKLSGGELTKEQTLVYRQYHIELVPWLWFLTQTSDCHIFFPDKETKTIKEIIESVFDRSIHVQADYELGNAQILASRTTEHCVQYRETDFNFISRMLEQYGVYYYFQHSDGAHKLVLSDQSNYKGCPEDKVDYPSQTSGIKDNCVTSWQHQFEFTSGEFKHTDYNFTTALANLESKSAGINAVSKSAGYEVYDFPGEYLDKGAEGGTEARIRQEEEEVPCNRVSGSSTCKSFSAGHQFNLASHPDDKIKALEIGNYLLTSVHHQAIQHYREGAHIQYTNEFTCVPSKIHFRPARITPKPIVSGVQTGVITGPKDKEIYTDKYGRVKVFFHWDRETREIKTSEGENCSCWIRVAQNMAGREWGFMAIPRIGQEVVVEFLEGDPDRPLVVGSVYNSDQMPHYDPVEHKTRTYFKTNSTEGGEGFNELMFEDLASKEMIFMHAQRNMDVRVRNDSTETIYGNRDQRIGYEKDGEKGGNQTETVMQDKHLNIKRNQLEKIEGNFELAVGHGDAESPGEVDFDFETSWKVKVGEEGLHTTVLGDENRQVNKSQSLVVNQAMMTKVGGNCSFAADGDLLNKGKNYSLEAETAINVKGGSACNVEAGQTMHLKSGTSLVIESGVNLSLKVGGNFISLTPAGIFIKGTLVGINSGGAAGSGSGSSPVSPETPAVPKEAKIAEPDSPELAHLEKTGKKSNS